ncbi:patatin-like phospholipase family protein [Candidatus Odyssella acanthamoebae]|uniref:PNPLA domain-containing protein n=1 Tax=Candidatus Odyssella acanthamoebae TaxID=91604 RepID=A0A077AWD2_9PROT|nr:patatin-like phospholipase family protein [Candidatus Paracaedibacter acanthamoebae]AIK96741.1 hypothetical protein ID47_08425 [Candidatus Paracaedibacter acanthamoebae]
MFKKTFKKNIMVFTLVLSFFNIFRERLEAFEAEGSSNPSRNKIYTALSIDGGGIRGLIPLRILEEIEKKTGKPICELFDYIGGTSTGALLTLGLTVPHEKEGRVPRYTVKSLGSLFTGEERFEVFSTSLMNKLKSAGKYLGSLYSAYKYETLLSKKVGNFYLNDALTNILITATEFKTKHMSVFCKEGKDIGNKILGGEILMREVMRATSAAPTYFQAAGVTEPTEDERGYTVTYYVDGGICCNNPAQLVWNRLQKQFNATPDNVYLLSLGTGVVSQEKLSVPGADACLPKWIPVLADYFMESNSWAVHKEMKYVLGKKNYKRVQPVLEAAIDLAGVDEENLERLEKAASSVMGQVDEICEQLKRAGKW